MKPQLDRSSLWTRMRFLLENLSTKLESDAFVDESLDLLIELLGARRGVICLRSSDGRWNAIAARKEHRTISVTEIDDRRAALFNQTLRQRRCVVYEGHREGDPASPRTLLALPLRRAAWQGAPSRPRAMGVLSLEIPGPESVIHPLHVEFIEAAAVLLAVTLDQRARIETMAEQVRADKAHETIDEGPPLDEMLDWDSMKPLRPDIQACIVGGSSVMILGESGTGKTRLAAALAKASNRTPIVRATLGASDDLNTITSELFGHERGAFSGAVTQRKGLVEYADEGTLILDEVLNLPPHAQQLLLDFTQFGTYRPLGYQGKEPKRADVRIISATNGNIRQAIVDTRFRQDLFFRLAGVTLVLPPLRYRRNEVPDLAQRYLRRLDPLNDWRLSAATRRLLLSEGWEWEGNIRQLQALMRRAKDRAVAEGQRSGSLDAKYIGLPGGALSVLPVSHPSPPPPKQPSLGPQMESVPGCTEALPEGPTQTKWTALQIKRSSLDDLERGLIEQAMVENRGIVAHAARELQVSRTSLLSRMTTLHLDKNKYKR